MFFLRFFVTGSLLTGSLIEQALFLQIKKKMLHILSLPFCQLQQNMAGKEEKQFCKTNNREKLLYLAMLIDHHTESKQVCLFLSENKIKANSCNLCELKVSFRGLFHI